MPSNQPLPTVSDLRKAYASGLVGLQDEFADTVTGSMYDVVGSIGAICLNQQTQRDQELFSAGYLDGATGADLTDLALKRYGIARILDTFGTGSATIQRPPGPLLGGTVYTGTRVVISGGAYVSPVAYVVASDTPVLPGQQVVTVPIHASKVGTGFATSAANPPYAITVPDRLFDNTFTGNSVNCTDGTTFEQDQAFKARIRTIRQALRVGYLAPLIQTCVAAGAVNVALFPSTFGSTSITDYGLNYIYVGDQNYNGTTALAQKCLIALEASRVLGADCAVLPMTSTRLSINAQVYLYDSPGRFNQNRILSVINSTFIQYFTGNQNAFGFTLSGLAGAAQAAVPEIQKIVFTTPSSDVTVSTITNGIPHFPAALPRYTLNGNNIITTLNGPFVPFTEFSFVL
jgi:hypothetical protein